uniref:GAG-pre-integrase domain-containing protein n=1 Tax=Chenopodium quinoa TaxID=63459 RepID=A0A803N438_CHEQI
MYSKKLKFIWLSQKFWKPSFSTSSTSDLRSAGCSVCGVRGHTPDRCWKVIGYPSWHHKSKSNSTQSRNGVQDQKWTKPSPKLVVGNDTDEELDSSFLGMVSCNTAAVVSSPDWIIDSGASDHMTSSLEFVINPIKCQQPLTINLPTGATSQVTHIGTVELPNSLYLQNVLVIPHFKHNLLSVHKMMKDSQCKVAFSNTHCVVRDAVSKKIKEIGKAKNGLYYLSSTTFNTVLDNATHVSSQTCLSVQSDSEKVPFAVWHHRLGHASIVKLKHIQCVKHSISENTQVCVTCPMAKFTKLPFELSSSRASESFELIHMDIWGPYKQKSESLSKIKEFSNYAHAHFDKLQPRGIPCVFLGYPATQKGYRILNIQTKKIFVSRDVTFNETILPFQLTSLDQYMNPVPTILTDKTNFNSAYVAEIYDSGFDNDIIGESDISSAFQNSSLSQHSSSIPPLSTSQPSQNSGVGSSSVEQSLENDCQVRQSSRLTKPPFWVKDYVQPKKRSELKISNLATQDISQDFYCFMIVLEKNQDPIFYKNVVTDPNWVTSMNQELEQCEKNGTWLVTALLEGKR